MRTINRVFIFGNLGKDPVVRQTSGGRSVCDLRVATTMRVRKGEVWEDMTEWHTIRLWEQKADLAQRYLSRGSAVGIEGSLRNESWAGKDGAMHYRTYVNCDNLYLLNGRGPRDAAEPRDGGGPSPHARHARRHRGPQTTAVTRASAGAMKTVSSLPIQPSSHVRFFRG